MRFQVIDLALLRQMKSRSFSLLVQQEAGDSAVLHRRWRREVIDEFVRRCREADPGPLALLSVLRQPAPPWREARFAALAHLCAHPHKSLTMLRMMREYPGADTDLRVDEGRQTPHRAVATAFGLSAEALGATKLVASARAATALWALVTPGPLPPDLSALRLLGRGSGTHVPTQQADH